jgi:hypothetical protein
MAKDTILGAILAVFNEGADWLVGALTTLMGVFYNAETGLTVMGVLGVSSLAIAVIFLVLGVIQNFLRFRA